MQRWSPLTPQMCVQLFREQRWPAGAIFQASGDPAASALWKRENGNTQQDEPRGEQEKKKKANDFRHNSNKHN